MDRFTTGYVRCALWSSIDDLDRPLEDHYDVEDIHPDAIRKIEEDCKNFQTAQAELLAEAKTIRTQYNDERAGHDFWLSRNGHGVGFFDRGLGEVGDKLQAAAKACGSCNLVVGSSKKSLDNWIHIL